MADASEPLSQYGDLKGKCTLDEEMPAVLSSISGMKSLFPEGYFVVGAELYWQRDWSMVGDRAVN